MSALSLHRLVPLLTPLLLLALAASWTPVTAEEPALLEFDKQEHDFGMVAQEQEVTAEFAYRNPGKEKVTGIRAIGDCGCYGVTLSATELEPGEKGTLKVNFRTLMFSGVVTKRIRVMTANDPRHPVRLLLKLQVVAGVIVDPGRIWFGDVLLGTVPSKTVVAKWHEDAGQPFELTAVEVPGHDFEVTTAPHEKGKWRGTAITLAFKKPPPLGMFSATALLRTNHLDYPRVSLALGANVTGKVWVQSRTVYFGWVPKGRSKKTMVLIRPFDQTVDLGEVTARAQDGRVKVHVEEEPMGRKGWWRLIVEVPDDAKVGKLDDRIQIHTAVPGEEITVIKVQGEVLELGR